MEKIIERKYSDFTILFEQLNKAKKEKGYSFMQGTMIAVSELQDPIERFEADCYGQRKLFL